MCILSFGKAAADYCSSSATAAETNHIKNNVKIQKRISRTKLFFCINQKFLLTYALPFFKYCAKLHNRLELDALNLFYIPP